MAASRGFAARRIGLGVAAIGLIGSATGAFAQASGCGDLQKYLIERKTIAESLSGGGKKKQIDAKVACAGFNRLVGNGATLMKWTAANKDWCQIPDSFVAGIKADHEKAVQIRSRACDVAAKQTALEKQAREGGGGGGLLGGGGLSGSTAMPKGAL